MLAVRDIDLFEAIPLPWEHRPVEVVKELLELSADLRVRDHSGRSASHYAANINSPLKEDIIHMMVEALSHTDAASMSLLDSLDKYPCQHLDSEFGDSDIELDLESLCPCQSTAASPTQTPTHQHDFLLYSHTGEVLESPGSPPLSAHHKGLRQVTKKETVSSQIGHQITFYKERREGGVTRWEGSHTQYDLSAEKPACWSCISATTALLRRRED
ncbi:uncharacterized protein LOC114563537 [Perca flavescens]|uniref:uncharacterized protein LOC114563537 n=1 Tax=Perca flavescens TaxID=8167 RepID=UPI00106E701C|nr:uncharacterized protein LOC114563537 [Perca flavescens]